jgi:hypothetical protein
MPRYHDSNVQFVYTQALDTSPSLILIFAQDFDYDFGVNKTILFLNITEGKHIKSKIKHSNRLNDLIESLQNFSFQDQLE